MGGAVFPSSQAKWSKSKSDLLHIWNLNMCCVCVCVRVSSFYITNLVDTENRLD